MIYNMRAKNTHKNIKEATTYNWKPSNKLMAIPQAHKIEYEKSTIIPTSAPRKIG
jgi:hypothetical protein